MKHEQLCGPWSGKLVGKIIGGITPAYYGVQETLHLGCLRDHWKGLAKKKNSEMGQDHDLYYGVC